MDEFVTENKRLLAMPPLLFPLEEDMKLSNIENFRDKWYIGNIFLVLFCVNFIYYH